MTRISGIGMSAWAFSIVISAGICRAMQEIAIERVAFDNVELDPATLRVHFIDVGPGLAVLIETPGDRKHFLIDGGDQGSNFFREYVTRFAGEGGGAGRIDAVIITHADHDHFRNTQLLAAVGDENPIDRWAIGQFWYTGYESDELKALARWPMFFDRMLNDVQIDFYSPLGDWVAPGDFEVVDDGGTADSTDDDVWVHYLNVDAQPPAFDFVSRRAFSENERRNNASLVFRIVYGEASFLFTGDVNGRDKSEVGAQFDSRIDSEELELWVRNEIDPDAFGLKSTVLQSAHHGSNGSNSLKFLQAVEPEWVVIPAGHKHNHPHPDTLRRMRASGIDEQRILRTDAGDSTPEDDAETDPTGDDSYIFVCGPEGIRRIIRVHQEPVGKRPIMSDGKVFRSPPR
jgi:competence protein ComEC